MGSGGGLFVSSSEESAVLCRFSTGEETEEVLRRLLAAGAYLWIERRLFRSRCLGKLETLSGAFAGALLIECRLRLRLRLRRGPSSQLCPLRASAPVSFISSLV